MDLEPIASDAAAVIQIALTPVFLLAGTAGCLNVFTARLARVSDRVNHLFAELNESDDPDEARLVQLVYLRSRTLALELAVILGTTSGVCTCFATLGLLLGAVREEFREQMLLWFFGGAVTALVGAFISFLFEIMLAGHAMLRQIAYDRALLERQRLAKAKKIQSL
ncbi:DUF2721 domain-containing protein [Sinorhizobium sp. BG8]|uniref:DUF2721 domain-containing protein n=1 Tax=Sinorhizobium sp. BG8 TaxID=2613773 RepID=UPI00193EB69D|nr:DUF2721 domain-containing protein [Sinorhizobium sp. BG8]QRM57433.1 DUF2721 domain-containing protein [Sinorhizobium sp. BG8]